MMTMTEAKQRLNMYDMRISRVQGTTEFRVAYAEENWRDAERTALYTDDLEDAVLTGAQMRRKKGLIAA
jgi:hypothetical protein